MALKDLVASKASLTEEAIEEIVSDYVRFDVDQKTVFLTPESHKLSNKAKILIYLTALQGWPFVIDEIVPSDAKPSEIEDHTGIPGGTLRPILKELKDRKIIFEKGGRYSVHSAALRTIKSETDGPSNGTRERRPKRVSQKQKDTSFSISSLESSDSDIPILSAMPKKRDTRKAASPINLAARFQSWIDEGFFNEWRTLSDVQKRFHREAIIVPQTSIPKYLLSAVRSRQLERDKKTINGRNVWAYHKTK
ncbi:hypothetical protein [Inquilinus limosus]|uniref:hypothetical protein n=1 Tax=Inquilinus limosus TaxID=171674 RepID=UPI00126A2970|nr:hypothetical protein [Inquilinus limosus]